LGKAPLRVQVVLSESERALLRREATAAGMSLSAWIREAALDRLRDRRAARRIGSVEELRAFFSSCDAQWDDHLDVLLASRREGLPRG